MLLGLRVASAPRQRLLAAAPGVIVLAQALWLRPRLAARARKVAQGGAPPPPSTPHLAYVACEVAKLGALLGLGLTANAGTEHGRQHRIGAAWFEPARMTPVSHELIDAVTGERIQAAVDRPLRLRAENGAAPLGTLAWTAVEEVFCSCVTGAEDAAEKHLSAIHVTLVADVLRRAEERLAEPSQAGGSERHKPS